MPWETIFKSKNVLEATVLKNTLDAAGIAAVMLNKQDASYPVLGYAEIQVAEQDLEAAMQLVDSLKADNGLND